MIGSRSIATNASAVYWTFCITYILQGTLSRRHLVDALHVASAVVADRDVVVSWNLRHLVKVKTRREVNAANLLNGYRTIEIATPEEMI